MSHISKQLVCIIMIGTGILFTATAQNGKPNDLKLYLKHMDILLQDGGKWKTPNRDYNPAEEWSASYLGYEYKKGIHANTLLLKITGYIPKKSQWVTFWDGFYTWDHKKQKLVYQSVNNNGAIASGESESIREEEMVLVFSITTPDGKVEKHKDAEKISGTNIISMSAVYTSGKWVPKNTLTWSRLEQPSGNLTFMTTRDGNFEIYSMDTKGENLKNLSCNKATDYIFSYFPKSSKYVFSTTRDGNEEIYIMEPDGKRQTNISNHPSGDRIPVVSPDGKQIVFLSYRDNAEGEIYIMDTLGNNVNRLTANKSFEDLASFSPDGKKIIFARQIKNPNDSTATATFELFTMNTDGSNEASLANSPGNKVAPQYSPDGSKIAYYGKVPGGNYEIFIMDADGKNIINLTEDPLEDYSPAWSPDGKWIAYTNGNSKNYDVWIIHVETRIKTRLTTQPKRDESPIWQPLY